MSKKVYLDNEGRKGLFVGIKLLSDAVGSTLGPTGKTVMIADGYGPPYATKDGVTVAKSIDSDDPLVNCGIQFIKSTSIKMDEKSGDGTTTATIQCAAMIQKGFEDAPVVSDFVSYKAGMEAAVTDVMKFIVENSITSLSKHDFENVAIISSNNDGQLGKLVAEAVLAAGEYGKINILESLRLKSSFEKTEGFAVDLGLADNGFSNDISGYFITKSAKILLHKGKITDKAEWFRIIDVAWKFNRDIIIIAQDYSTEVLELAKFANMNAAWKHKVCLVRNPMRENEFDGIYKDLEVYAGANIINKFVGDADDFGDLQEIIIKPGYSIFGKTDEDCSYHIDDLKSAIETTESLFEKEDLRKRISRFTDGFINFYVGGYSEVEAKEKFDRVQDAVHSCKAAKEKGIVIGGGQILYKYYWKNRKIVFANNTNESFNLGFKNVIEACKTVTEQIYLNSKQHLQFSEIEDMIIPNDNTSGFDFKNNVAGDLIKLGIVDPVKVVINGLLGAVSIASTILTTECVIVENNNNGSA